MVGMMRMHSVQFRHHSGPVDLVQPKGSKLLRVYQSGSGYWFADMLSPEMAHEEEPLRLWLISHKDTQTSIGDNWQCVGDSVNHQERRVYVFQQTSAPAKRKPGRPRKAAQKPPVDPGTP
jgi:hypothetical protein